MLENKMKTYLGENYSENSIRNFLKYWQMPSEPREENDLEKLGGPKMAADIIYCFNASLSNRCMEKEAYEELLKFYEDIEKLEDDIYDHLGFIFDIFVELYTIYLDRERYW